MAFGLKDSWYTLQHILRDKKIEISLEQINRYLELGNAELMRTVYGRVGEEKGYENDQAIMDALLPFKAISNITLTSGAGVMPNDYWHKSRMEDFTTGVKIAFVSSEECGRKRDNTITAPSTSYPIVELLDGTFQVYPTTITKVKFVYLKKGNIPTIALKTENSIQVYDATNSVEPEWNTPEKFIDLIRIIMGYLNIPMTNEQVLSYTEAKTDKEN
jgi:hypothetical protein